MTTTPKVSNKMQSLILKETNFIFNRIKNYRYCNNTLLQELVVDIHNNADIEDVDFMIENFKNLQAFKEYLKNRFVVLGIWKDLKN